LVSNCFAKLTLAGSFLAISGATLSLSCLEGTEILRIILLGLKRVLILSKGVVLMSYWILVGCSSKRSVVLIESLASQLQHKRCLHICLALVVGCTHLLRLEVEALVGIYHLQKQEPLFVNLCFQTSIYANEREGALSVRMSLNLLFDAFYFSEINW